MTIRSTAKINLFLDITGKDPADGYHFIDSVFQEVDLADEITVSYHRGGRDEIVFSDPSVGEGSTVHQALALFREKYGIRENLRVRVKKNIPIGAGLGGGSSNAAFLLMALGKRYGVPREELIVLGKRIGSDVPFFFYGGMCRVTGKGEIVESWKTRIKGVVFLLVYPNIPVSTKWAYSLITDYQARNKPEAWVRQTALDIDFLKKIIYNKFEHFVIQRTDQLQEAKSLLDRSLEHDLSFMSGSGSTLVFAYTDGRKAKKDLKKVTDTFGFRGFMCGPIYRTSPGRDGL